MNSQEELLSFMDFLDLDEDIIDTRLKSLMVKSNHTNKQLANIIQLLLYKNLINSQESTECDNEGEFEFIVKLLPNVCDDNVEQIRKIINIILCLNPSTIVRKSEHLVQQILSSLFLQPESSVGNDNYLLTSLKICDSILDAVLKNGEKLNLIFFDTPLANILNYTNDKLKIFFLNNVVPKFIKGVVGYNILDSVWIYLTEHHKNDKDEALKIMSTLSEYYLPIVDKKKDQKIESEVASQYYFWDTVLFGLNSNDPTSRKISIYLAKKGVEYALQSKKNINVLSESKLIFAWKVSEEKELKNMWDNFFILIDSLEEKQSNIVLPSLKLFDAINIGDCWIICAYNMGLKHDNMQIKIKCLEYRFKTRISNEIEAIILLETLNDINLYDNIGEYEKIKQGLHRLFEDKTSFFEIVKAIPKTKWSPVPFYHLSDVFSKHRQEFNDNEMFIAIVDILKISCNNIAIRRAVHVNILQCIKNCLSLDWKQLATIYSVIQIEGVKHETHPIVALVKALVISEDEKYSFYRYLSETKCTLDFILCYISNHAEDKNIFASIVNENIKNILDIVNRQYSDKKICFNDVIFLLNLLNGSTGEKDSIKEMLHESVSSQYKYLILYLMEILSGDTKFNIKEIIEVFTAFSFDSCIDNTGADMLTLYKAAVIMLKDTCDLDKAVASAFVIAKSLNDSIINKKYKHEMLNIKGFMSILGKLQFSEHTNQSMGRYRNAFYEKSCEILYHLIRENEDYDTKEMIIYIENVIECGGYGCLKWILKIANEVANNLITHNFNIIQFLNKTWNEIEELKSNNQYTPCIEEFVNFLTNNAILQKSTYNNVVMLYCNKIIDYGPLRNTSLYYLTIKLRSKNFEDYGHLLYVLCDILLYWPVTKKDQRIIDNVTLEILENPKFGVNEYNLNSHFNYEIQFLAATILSKITNVESLGLISTLIISRIQEMFKNKQRYHGHSQMHKVLLGSLQHLLIMLLKPRHKQSDTVLNWSFELLAKLPHQQSVKVCFEWFIALNLYKQEKKINEKMVELMKANNVPLLSQFFITYSLLKQKVANNSYTDEEYSFVLDLLMSNTMGPLFNVRLIAQYLSIKLFKMVNKPNKYAYTIDIIERTLAENANDKNYLKLKNDYFINEFSLVDNLNPCFIYYYLPRYCEGSNNEMVNEKHVEHMMDDIEHNLIQTIQESDFSKEWLKRHKKNVEFLQFKSNVTDKDIIENTENVGTIQKKYIPWNNMSDVNVYDVAKKKETVGDLIVVASLIDKLPNLGGMARTSEVFGVKTYVLDSLRHLQDKQFQGLSVSAERWINVEEVRPGKPLKEYLTKKKTEGYSVVAAEQTSTSSKLESFKFPKKTLLLLGHEKEGIPCDLLPMMDHCVEIPQQGFVRSLNVHVTAAIFVWEYTRQNIL